MHVIKKFKIMVKREVELIIQGEVQGVGYRQYVAKIGRRLKLAGCVKNLKDGAVQIRCMGDEEIINEFKKKINTHNPHDAPLIDVEDIKEIQLAQGTIKQTHFEEIYDDPSAEMSQGFSTGMSYMNLFRYDLISKGMLAIVEIIEERNKTFESRMEKTEKNIESLLKILADKKKW